MRYWLECRCDYDSPIKQSTALMIICRGSGNPISWSAIVTSEQNKISQGEPLCMKRLAGQETGSWSAGVITTGWKQPTMTDCKKIPKKIIPATLQRQRDFLLIDSYSGDSDGKNSLFSKVPTLAFFNTFTKFTSICKSVNVYGFARLLPLIEED